jgi:hypothetical protein
MDSTIPIEGLHFDQSQLSSMLQKYNEIGMQIELVRLFVSMNREVIPSSEIPSPISTNELNNSN